MPINAGFKGEQYGPPVIFPHGTQEQLDTQADISSLVFT